MNWHLLSVNEVLNVTGSSENGITDMVAQTRLQEYGPNELQQAKKRSPFMMFVRQFMDVMILVLVAAALISGLIGDVKDTIVIIAIVILNAVIGFIQEYRAEKAMESLKKMAAPFANVIRNKQFISIPATELVPGDIVLLEAGNMVPADLRIIETNSLKIDEASLTGESHNIEKIIHVLQGEDVSIGDRVNLAFKGTYVTYGRGKGVVVATGMNTELGQIARMLQEKEQKTFCIHSVIVWFIISRGLLKRRRLVEDVTHGIIVGCCGYTGSPACCYYHCIGFWCQTFGKKQCTCQKIACC
jgi:P-type Ca2+ transporter type 2C